MSAATKPESATRLIGLTGGIGSGKSTVAQMLVQQGAVLVDADALSREATAAGGAALPAIRAAFGDAVFDPHGQLDRAALRQQVFASADARRQLEAIVHPLVREEVKRRIAQAVAAAWPLVVVDVPLLVESGGDWRSMVDAVVVVDCSVQTQMARVMQRSGLAPEQAQAIIASQASRAQRLVMADFVIFNDGITLEQLSQRVSELASHFGL